MQKISEILKESTFEKPKIKEIVKMNFPSVTATLSKKSSMTKSSRKNENSFKSLTRKSTLKKNRE